MTSEIEHTFLRKCDVESLRTGGAWIWASQQTRDALHALEKKYDIATKSHIRKLKGFISKLSDTDVFYYFNEKKTNIVERRTAIDCLMSDPSNNISFKIIQNKTFEHYSLMDIHYEYLSFGFDGLKQWIGEENENKRVCRFCGGRKPVVKFDKVAHAIQDALGNKLLFCYEECDVCNLKMARVEDNFRVLMDFRRSMYHIPRKETSKSANVEGKNFVIRPDVLGMPELYIMDEAIPVHTDRSKPFMMRLELKTPMVNEDMYKALCKMVIDLLPTKELKHFKQTISWINPSESWMPDSLPSILTHYITSEEITYSQPVLDIFINNKQNLVQSPYCTAVLYIYDMMYMFIIPMVDVDGGKFKYDKALDAHWQEMAALLDVWKWVLQDSSNYQCSTAWVNWRIDTSLPNVHILPKDDAVFEKCHIRQTPPIGVVFPSFKWNGIIQPKVLHANFKCHYFKDVSLSDLSDITQHYSGPVFRIEPQSKQVFVKLRFESNDTTDSVRFFDIDFEVSVELESFDSYINIETDGEGFTTSFAIDRIFCENIYKLALFHADQELEKQRVGTPFERCRLDRVATNDRLLSNAYYLVPMGNGNYRTIKDNKIHGVVYHD